MGYASKFTIDGQEAIVKDANAVSTIANQGLTEQQKVNARSNIGAGDSDFSGSYNDLSDKPTIGSGILTIQKNGVDIQTFGANDTGNKTANITMDKSDVGLNNVPNVTTDNQTPTFTEASTRTNIASGETLTVILGKIKKFFTDLKTVAFSGSYNDLSDKPTIPTVNNATLTIQKNGVNVQTFTANQSTNATANITVPTKVSELTNDSGYTTNTGTVTQVKVGTTAYNPSSGVVSLPAYPTVNNATLTIQKNGTNVQTFTANQSSNATANITVPTKVSELTNDSGYTTNTGTVTQVKVGTTAYNPSSGVVSLPAYPTVNNATLTIQKNGSNVATFTANQSSNATANITVPTVNNGTLTIQKNGSNVATFTANQSGNATANITVPTKTSQLTNDDGWVLISSSTGNAATFTTLNGSVYHSLMLEFYIQVNGSTWLTLATPLTIQSITGSNNGTTRIIRTGYKGVDPEYLMIQASLNSTSLTLSTVQCNYNVTSKVVYLYAKK